MLLKNILRGTIAASVLAAAFSFTALASSKEGVVDPIKIVVDSDYILYKVNDPVTRMTKQAYIVCDNAEFHFVSGSYNEAETIFYINEFISGQDAGVSNRVLKKKVRMGEQLTMLPEDVFDEDVSDGSAYRFTDRCYDVRVYYGPGDNYDDFYFGLVDSKTFEKMSESIGTSEEKEEVTEISYTPGPVAG
ncbi:MAG: hypothetical protein K6A76_06375 [Oribacterium sp.]|nr:hypothetical protein [Oribacterium sp.]